MVENAIQKAEKALSQLSYRTRLLVLGVLTPGFLLAAEISLSYVIRTQGALDYSSIKQYANFVGQTSLVLVALAVLLILSIAFALGFVCRELTFSASNFWVKRGWRPCRDVCEVLLQIEAVYGRMKVDGVRMSYPIFEIAKAYTRAGAANEGVLPKRLPRMPELYIREYCKLWLRMKVPSLATDDIEAEINVVIGLVVPTAAASLPLLAAYPNWAGVSLAGGCLALAAFIFFKINSTRSMETETVLVNFFFAHWENLHTRETAAKLHSSGSVFGPSNPKAAPKGRKSRSNVVNGQAESSKEGKSAVP